MKKTINKLTDFLNENKVYVLTIIIMITILMICQMLSYSTPFGTNNLVSGDGILQDYPVFMHRMRAIKNGELIKYFTFDIAGFWDVYRADTVYFIYHPWMIALFYFIPQKYALALFNLEFILNFVFSSVAIIFYLTHKQINPIKKSNNYLIYFALAYGLCNYSLAFFQYKCFMFLQYIPLIALGLEQALYKKKPALYICTLILAMIFDPYHAFLLCEFLVLLFFLIDFKSIKDFFIKGIHFAIYSIIAALLSCIELLPFLFSIVSESAYKEADNERASLFHFFESFVKVFSDYYLGNKYIPVSDYTYKSGIYCGLFILALIPIYIMTKQIKKSLRIRYIAILVLLFISFNNELLNYIFHGFHFQSMVPNRYAAFYIFILICLVSDASKYLSKIKNYNKILLLSTLLIDIIFINLITFTQDVNSITYKIAIIFPLLYFISIVVLYIKKSPDYTFKTLILIASLELCFNSFINFTNILGGTNTITNITPVINDILEDNPEMRNFYNTTQYLGDNPLYDNIGLSTDINSLSFFTSGITTYHLNRIAYYNIYYSSNNIQYRCGNPLADIMLRIKYHIEDTKDYSSYSTYKEIYQYNEYIIHENDNSINFGTVIQNQDDNYPIQKEDESSFLFQNKISNYVNCEDIYTPLDLELYSESSNSDLANNNYYSFGQAYKNTEINTTVMEYVPVNIHFKDSINGYIYVNINGYIYLIGEVNEDNHELSVDYPKENVLEKDFKPDIAVLNNENLEKLAKTLKENEMNDLKEDGKTIEGKYNSNTDGTLYISIPYSNNWNIIVDGKNVDYMKYLGGIGVKTTKGEHSIIMKYNPPGMKSGVLISVITLALLIIYSIIMLSSKKKANTKIQK